MGNIFFASINSIPIMESVSELISFITNPSNEGKIIMLDHSTDYILPSNVTMYPVSIIGNGARVKSAPLTNRNITIRPAGISSNYKNQCIFENILFDSEAGNSLSIFSGVAGVPSPYEIIFDKCKFRNDIYFFGNTITLVNNEYPKVLFNDCIIQPSLISKNLKIRLGYGQYKIDRTNIDRIYEGFILGQTYPCDVEILNTVVNFGLNVALINDGGQAIQALVDGIRIYGACADFFRFTGTSTALITNGLINGVMSSAACKLQGNHIRLENTKFQSTQTQPNAFQASGLRNEIINCVIHGDTNNGGNGLILHSSGTLIMQDNVLRLTSNLANRCQVNPTSGTPILIYDHNICISDFPVHGNQHIFIPNVPPFAAIACLNEGLVVNNPLYFAKYLGNV